MAAGERGTDLAVRLGYAGVEHSLVHDTVKAIESLNLEGGILVVVSRDESVSWLSLRNVPTVHVLSPDQLNTYDVLVCDQVLFTKSALETFLAGPSTGKALKATAKESEVQA